jgi:hypothetical protein
MDAPGTDRGRDALRVDIDPSQDLLVVGARFSVFLTVTNVADGPVTVTDIAALYPPEFEPVATRPPADDAAGGGTAGLPAVLQPGDAFQHQVSLRHRTAPFFAPANRDVAFNIRFEEGGQARHIAPKAQLALRPPLHYLMAGAVVGALVAFFIVAYGSILTLIDPPPAGAQPATDPPAVAIVIEDRRQAVVAASTAAPEAEATDSSTAAAAEQPLPPPTVPRLLGSLVVSVIVGVVAVVAGQFTKRGVTVEDFWGAVLVAFTVVLASTELVGLAQRATVASNLVTVIPAPAMPTDLSPDEWLDDGPATPTAIPK